jgi:hypothetical protein
MELCCGRQPLFLKIAAVLGDQFGHPRRRRVPENRDGLGALAVPIKTAALVLPSAPAWARLISSNAHARTLLRDLGGARGSLTALHWRGPPNGNFAAAHVGRGRSGRTRANSGQCWTLLVSHCYHSLQRGPDSIPGGEPDKSWWGLAQAGEVHRGPGSRRRARSRTSS